MKKICINVMAFIAMIVPFTSCVHYYYAPSSNNVPLFKEKKEGRMQAQFSSGNAYSGFEIQSAYAVAKHAAVQLNIFSAGKDDGEYGSGHGTYAEVAGGYFKPFYKKRFVFETYAGFGSGSVKNIFKNTFDYTSAEAKTSVKKFFIQPSVGFASTYFDIALSSKFSGVATGVKYSTLTKENFDFDYEQVSSLKGKSYFYWEPGIMIRGGFKQIKFSAQVTYSAGNKTQFPVDDTNISLGIMVPFIIKQK